MSVYKLASSFSSLGILLILVVIMITQASFIGNCGEEYSFGVHFISELGNPNKSEFHFLLNIGFMVISILFIPMTFLLGKYTDSKWGKIAGIIGVFAMLSVFAVGSFPETNYIPHFIAAISFFTISAITTAVFAGLSLSKKNKLKRTLFLPSVIPVILYLTFLIYPKTELLNIQADPYYARPEIVWLAVFEWLYFFTMCFWVLCASFTLWKYGK